MFREFGSISQYQKVGFFACTSVSLTSSRLSLYHSISHLYSFNFIIVFISAKKIQEPNSWSCMYNLSSSWFELPWTVSCYDSDFLFLLAPCSKPVILFAVCSYLFFLSGPVFVYFFKEWTHAHMWFCFLLSAPSSFTSNVSDNFFLQLTAGHAPAQLHLITGYSRHGYLDPHNYTRNN